MSWWNADWDDLHPATQEHIGAQRVVPTTNPEKMKRWACGCERAVQEGGHYWHLCAFHEGFDEGVSMVGVPVAAERDGN